MTAKAGRLEAQITFADDVASTWTDSIGATVVTIPAGSYYPSELVAEINDQLGNNWTVTTSDGEGSPSSATGRVTINTSDTPYSVAWTNVALRNVLGFDADISNVAAAQTGAGHCLGLWLPGCAVKFSRHGDQDPGTIVDSNRQTVGPSGTVKTLSGPYYRVVDGLRWDGVPAQRVRPHHEQIDGESLEAWWRTTQLGDHTSFEAGASVRIYWDADDDGVFLAGRFLWPQGFDPQTLITGWVGRYVIELPRFVVAS